MLIVSIIQKGLIFLSFGAGLAISACHQDVGKSGALSDPSSSTASAPSTDCRMIVHEMGETEVCGQPQRIVVLGAHALEALLLLDEQPVAFAASAAYHQGDYDNPAQQIPYLGRLISHPVANLGLAGSPTIEGILKAQPDLILDTDWGAGQYETFSKIAPTLQLKWAEPEQSLRIVAQALNRADRAEKIIAETEAYLSEMRRAFAPFVADHPQVLLLIGEDLQALSLGNTATGFCSALIEELGFELVAPSGFGGAEVGLPAPISLETLPQLNEADAVILLGSNFSPLNQIGSLKQFEAHQTSKLEQAWEDNEIAQSLTLDNQDD